MIDTPTTTPTTPTIDITKFKFVINEEYGVINRIDTDGNTYFCPITDGKTVDLQERSIVDEYQLEEDEQEKFKNLHKELYDKGIVNPGEWFE